METTIVLVGLIVFSFAISRLLTRFAARFFVVSGVEYIVLGLVLGPVTHVLDANTMQQFRPLIALLLGLVGFILGLKARDLGQFPRSALAGFVSASLVLVSVAAVMLVALEWIGFAGGLAYTWRFPPSIYEGSITAHVDNLRLATTVGCCAAVASPVMLSDSAKLLRASGPILETLKVKALVSQVVAVFVFGGVMVSARHVDSISSELPLALWIVGVVVFAAVSGLLFTRFVGSDRERMRIYVAAVGVVTFASGVAVAIGVSPVAINFVAGLTVAVSSPDAVALERILVRLRHPVLVLVRLFAGVAWIPLVGPVHVSKWIFLVGSPFAYSAVRGGVRRMVTYPIFRLFDRRPIRLPRIGQGLGAQGGLASAIALSYSMRFPDQAAVVLTTVLGGLILSDLGSHRALRRVLADAGELDRLPSQEARERSDHAAGTGGERLEL